jgi:hypothetical protein
VSRLKVFRLVEWDGDIDDNGRFNEGDEKIWAYKAVLKAGVDTRRVSSFGKGTVQTMEHHIVSCGHARLVVWAGI